MRLAAYRQAGHPGFAERTGGGYARSVAAYCVSVLGQMHFRVEAAEFGGELLRRVGALGCRARDVSIQRAAHPDDRRDDDRRIAEDLVQTVLQRKRRIGIDHRRDRECDVPSVIKSERAVMHVLHEGNRAAARRDADGGLRGEPSAPVGVEAHGVSRAGQLSDRVTINPLGASAEQRGYHDRGAKTYGRNHVRDACLPSCAAEAGCEHGNKGYQPKLA